MSSSDAEMIYAFNTAAW